MMASVYENYGSNNCLHICAMQSSFECFDILIDYFQIKYKDELLKKIVNKRNRQLNTPIHEAFLSKQYLMVNHILKRCEGLIDENIENEKGLKVVDLKKEFTI